jgi:hypothetical protein
MRTPDERVSLPTVMGTPSAIDPRHGRPRTSETTMTHMTTHRDMKPAKVTKEKR